MKIMKSVRRATFSDDHLEQSLRLEVNDRSPDYNRLTERYAMSYFHIDKTTLLI